MSLNKRVALALVLSAGAICVLIASGALNDVLAQTGPLGVPRPSTPGAPPPDGFTGWLLAKQAEYYRAMSGAIRGAKTDNTALLALVRPCLRVWNFSRRRSRPRQGGDLVLSRRQ